MHRIEEFYSYKANDKNAIIADQLNLEALFNNLAMVPLSHLTHTHNSHATYTSLALHSYPLFACHSHLSNLTHTLSRTSLTPTIHIT